MNEHESAMEAISKIAAKALADILEHADSVRIFVTVHQGGAGDSGETATITFGGGNFYAQIGQVAEWLTRMNQVTRDNATKEPSDE